MKQEQKSGGNLTPPLMPRFRATSARAVLLGACLLGGSIASAQSSPTAMIQRPPSVPLVLHDPFLSIWSPADKLTDAETVHWTGAAHPLSGIAVVDGRPYRFLGREPSNTPALEQKSLVVTPTQTLIGFEGAGIKLDLTFTTPALPDDLDLLSRPITYVSVKAASADGRPHKVALEMAASTLLAGDGPSSGKKSGARTLGSLKLLTAENKTPRPLAERGDWTRINWGRLLFAAPAGDLASASFSQAKKLVSAKGDAYEDASKGVLKFAEFETGATPVTRWLMIGYDDELSIQYFKQNLQPYWRRKGETGDSILLKAAKDREAILARCEAFDKELMADLTAAGGESYAYLCALSYRQCLAGNKIAADPKGQPLLFPKENTSNGCIATVDVIYPMAPQFFLFGPSLSKAMLVPILDYASSPRWKFPFAPHDLGTYPQANGQVYGGGEKTEENQMPVEESANMLILMAVLAQMEGKADFSARYWPTLTKWAEYLKAKGFDPENQLCTDDFLGHLAHNVNLSAKAIVGLACYAKLAEMKGDKAAAKEYRATAESFAAKWVKEADDGKTFRLTFDRPGTWSQKYNLVWDKILGLNLFPDSVRQKEMAHYRTVVRDFGLPLDSRGTGSKSDWTLWTATLTQNRADFDFIASRVLRFVQETPNRVGFGDWYDTATGKHLFMHSRPVMGGSFLQMLYNQEVWRKWSSRDKAKVGGWAPLPKPVKVTPLIAAADTAPAEWSFTTIKPGAGWEKPGFDDSSWSRGISGFGAEGTPGAHVKTKWDTGEIWLRREVTLKSSDLKNLRLWLHHDEDVEVYINGVLAFSAVGWTTGYEAFEMTPAGLAALKSGKNQIAVKCRQTSGGQYIDLGFVKVS